MQIFAPYHSQYTQQAYAQQKQPNQYNGRKRRNNE